ncbi:MAG TPA: hypothetical protein VGO67_17735 [Verrucomicrobiae bacterium]|jgi:hypothetical protein
MFFDEASEEAPEGLLNWKFTLDNPTPLGWTVVAAYLAAAMCCIRAALKSRNNLKQSRAVVWWILAAGLVFLGINKQLNLQTLMIVIGRNISDAGGWYGERRKIQLIFAIVFGAFSFAALIWVWRKYGEFFRENPLMLAGAVILVLFVVMRSASINHVIALPIFGFKDDQWGWILEIMGSSFIAAGALRWTAGAGERVE